MILSNVELHRALDDGRLVIKPEPKPRRPAVGQAECPYNTHSVDLRLAPEISVPPSGPFIYDPNSPGVSGFIYQVANRIQLDDDRTYTLRPNHFVLGMTQEWIGLPILTGQACLAARIEGKSSRARLGLLVHFTAPTVHPGFEGNLTLEIINLGHAEILLRPGMAIAQLIVEQVLGTPFENPSQFQNQSTPEGVAGGDEASGSKPA